MSPFICFPSPIGAIRREYFRVLHCTCITLFAPRSTTGILTLSCAVQTSCCGNPRTRSCCLVGRALKTWSKRIPASCSSRGGPTSFQTGSRGLPTAAEVLVWCPRPIAVIVDAWSCLLTKWPCPPAFPPLGVPVVDRRKARELSLPVCFCPNLPQPLVPDYVCASHSYESQDTSYTSCTFWSTFRTSSSPWCSSCPRRVSWWDFAGDFAG